MGPSAAGGGGSGGVGAAADDDDDRFTYCVGSPTWRPHRYIADAELHARARAHLERDDFYAAIAESFSLTPFNGNEEAANAGRSRSGSGSGSGSVDKAKRQDTYGTETRNAHCSSPDIAPRLPQLT